MALGMKNDAVLVHEGVWDFDVDGGAQGVFSLMTLPVGAVVQKVVAKVQTAVTSGGALTMEWGDLNDADGYSGAAKAVGALTLNAVFDGQADSAALLPVSSVNGANAQAVGLTIGGADATAGKVVVMVQYLYPKA